MSLGCQDTKSERERAIVKEREPIVCLWWSRHEVTDRGQSKRMMGKERKGVSKIEAKQDRESEKKTISEK
jgi:hypothetical protein